MLRKSMVAMGKEIPIGMVQTWTTLKSNDVGFGLRLILFRNKRLSFRQVLLITLNVSLYCL